MVIERDPNYKKVIPFPPQHFVSLKVPYPGVPQSPSSEFKVVPPKVNITTLENGIRVVTEDSPSQASALCALVEIGTVNETDETAGMSRILERMAFKSTKNRSAKELVSAVEDMGSNVMSSSSREFYSISIDVQSNYLERIMELTGDIMTNLSFDPEELEEQKKVLEFELMQFNEDPTSKLPEILHFAAFGTQPLGRSLAIDPLNIQKITPESVRKFHETFFQPDRIVVAGSGVDHNTVVNLTRKYFQFPKTESLPVIKIPSVYLGGDLRFSEGELGPIKENSKEPDKSQLLLSFEAPTLHNPDLYPLAILISLLGGGNSFSSGGPGKGMHSRLYQNVLNGNSYVDSAMAFASTYLDSGLFGLHMSFEHGNIMDALQLIVSEMLSIINELTPQEFARAQNHCRSNFFMSLESRLARAEDLGKQLITFGKVFSLDEVNEKLQAVTMKDVQKLLRNMMISKPTLVLYGRDVDSVPTAEQLHSFLKEHLGEEGL